MGFVKCFPTENSKEIYIVYTDTLKRNDSVVLSFDLNKSDPSIQEVSRYLQENPGEIKPTLREKNHKEFLEICHNIDENSGENVGQHSVGKSRKYSVGEWIAFLSVCVVMATNISIVHAFGTLFPYILSEFGESRASAATVQSVLFGVGLCSGFIVGSIVQYFGPWKCGIFGSGLFSAGFIFSYSASSAAYLVLSCGVMSGMGFSFLTISSNQAASMCFEGNARIVGLSVVSSAIGIGGIAYPYLLTWMVDTYGLQGTFLIMGGITLNGIPMALLWKHTSRRTDVSPDSQSGQKDFGLQMKQLILRAKETIQCKPYVAALIGFALAMPSVNMFEILALDVLESSGLTRNTSVILFTVLNAVSIPGRLIPGLIKRLRGISSMKALIVGTLISGLGMLLINFTHALAGSGIACAALGLSKGMLLSSVQIIVLEMLDTYRFSIGLGTIFGMVGLCTTAIGPINGLVRDISGSYTYSLYGAATTMVVSLILFCISMLLNSRINAKKFRERSVSIFTVTRF